MKPVAFAYARPESLSDALSLLQQHGSEGRIIAGGQSLGAMLNMRLVTPKLLIDINRIQAASDIQLDKSHLRIGATVRQSDALNSPLTDATPLLKLALPHVGHFQTRNRGTICGSISHADPSAELPLALLVCDGTIELRSTRAKRLMSAQDFFISTLTTDRHETEMVTATLWPKASKTLGCAFDEFAVRGGDYAIVAAGAQVQLDQAGNIAAARVGLAGVGERPTLIDTDFSTGSKPTDELADEIAQRARRMIEPISDLQASAKYRLHLAGIFAKNVFNTAARKAMELCHV